MPNISSQPLLGKGNHKEGEFMIGGPHVTNGQENEKNEQIRPNFVKLELFWTVRLDDFLVISVQFDHVTSSNFETFFHK